MLENILHLLGNAIWYILPAYVANASAVVVHGRHPLDQGLKFFDGKPLLGKGKTLVGFFSGIFFGFITGILQSMAEYPHLGFFSQERVVLALVLSFGAMVGDSLGSFIKRRFDLKQGQATPLLDQWDFVFGAFLMAYIFKDFVQTPDLIVALTILVITPFIHIASNYIAFKLKLKGVPW